MSRLMAIMAAAKNTFVRIALVVFASVAAGLFFFAVSFDSWDCPGGLLGEVCSQSYAYKSAGIILIMTGVCLILAAFLLLLSIFIKRMIIYYIGMGLTIAGLVMAFAGVFYYLGIRGVWSPLIAAIGMFLTIALFTIEVVDVVSQLPFSPSKSLMSL